MNTLTTLFTDHILGTQGAIVVIALLIISALSRRFFFQKPKKESPYAELSRRFSTGEINYVQYEQLKRELQKEEDLRNKSFFLSRV